MELNDYDTTKTFTATVLRSDRITPDDSKHEVRDITIELDGFFANAGQNFGVLAPGRAEMGQQHHFRLYSVADVPAMSDEGRQRFSICVRRCTYIDEFSGEQFPGVASNYLCDLVPGDTLSITGPYEQVFQIPTSNDAKLIMIGAGTGIAPFRAFIKHLYAERPQFAGHILLFHGAQTGIDLLYRNQEKDDFALYYDKETFDAIDVLSRRPGWSESLDWGSVLGERGEQISELLADPETFVYLAGLRRIRDELDHVFAEIIGSEQEWLDHKAALTTNRRWVELLY